MLKIKDNVDLKELEKSKLYMKKYMVAYAYETLSGSYIFARQVYEIENTITEQTFEDLEALLKTEFSTNVVVVGITKLDEVYVKEVL